MAVVHGSGRGRAEGSDGMALSDALYRNSNRDTRLSPEGAVWENATKAELAVGHDTRSVVWIEWECSARQQSLTGVEHGPALGWGENNLYSTKYRAVPPNKFHRSGAACLAQPQTYQRSVKVDTLPLFPNPSRQ